MWASRTARCSLLRLPGRQWAPLLRQSHAVPPPMTTTTMIRRHTASSRSTLDQESSRRIIAWWVPVLGGFGITCLGGLTYFYQQVGSLEGLRRSIYFYAFAIPKYVEYRYHLWAQSPPQTWEELDRNTSAVALQKILSLTGFYIKAGQMVASNVGNGFPQIWQDTMSVLQDQVPAQPFPVIRQIVSSEMDFDQTFSSFEETPIGAASIGQVHRAVLRSTGQPVVVKVCYPHVERLLKGDVRTIKLFAKLAQPVHVPALEEVEVQFATEFDYRREAQHMAEIGDNLRRAGWADGPHAKFVVPRPYLQYCTKHVLVMEELQNSHKLVVGLRQDLERQAARMGKTAEQLLQRRHHTNLRQFQRETEHPEAASHDGNSTKGPSSSQYEKWIGLVNHQRRLDNFYSALYNYTWGYLSGSPRVYRDKSELPLNHAQFMDDLFLVHGHQVLVDGLFNGDPHPGNILLCRHPDGSPQLGLIDFGQVKRLSKADRHLFCRIILALADDDKPRIVELMKDAGFVSQRMDPDVIYSYAKVAYDEDNRELTKGLHIQMFMEYLQSCDPIQELPYDFIVIGRCSVILRGLAHALQQPRSTAKLWKPIAERVLRENL